MRHGAARIWWKPWRKRCTCGGAWFPCPDSITMDTPGSRLQRRPPAWNAPTAYYPTGRNERSLMTPGQEWRTRQTRR